MTSSSRISPDPPGMSGRGTAATANTAARRAPTSRTMDFLKPTLVSIGIELSSVAFLIALLLLMISLRPGDGGNHGGGSGDGTSGQGGTGEYAVTGSGSGTAKDEAKTTNGSAVTSQEVTEVSESPGSSRPQQPPAPSPGTSGIPLVPPEDKSNAYIVQDLPQPATDADPEGTGGGNGFSDLSDRLRQAGAKTGDVQISLAWNNGNDLDLHVETPGNEKIWYNQRQSTCGGELDVDMNAGGPESQRPVENIYWPSGESPSGAFRVMVHHYANHGGRDPTRFQVTIKVKDKTQSFSGSLRFGDASRLVQEFTFP